MRNIKAREREVFSAQCSSSDLAQVTQEFVDRILWVRIRVKSRG